MTSQRIAPRSDSAPRLWALSEAARDRRRRLLTMASRADLDPMVARELTAEANRAGEEARHLARMANAATLADVALGRTTTVPRPRERRLVPASRARRASRGARPGDRDDGSGDPDPASPLRRGDLVHVAEIVADVMSDVTRLASGVTS